MDSIAESSCRDITGIYICVCDGEGEELDPGYSSVYVCMHVCACVCECV